MISTAHLVAQFQYNINKLIEIAESVDREHWASQPGGVRNHAAWTLPHLAVANGELLELLGKDRMCPESWNATTGGGSEPTMDRSHYAPDAELIDTLRKQAEAVTVEAIEATDLAAEYPDEHIRQFFPTVGQGVAFFLTDHLADHKGQLLAWRRALKASLEHE